MLYAVIVVALVMLLCRYFYVEGVKKTFEIYMKIAEEELLGEDFNEWNDDLIKYRKNGLRLKFFSITDSSMMQNYSSLRDVAAAMLYSVFNQGEREASRQ